MQESSLHRSGTHKLYESLGYGLDKVNGYVEDVVVDAEFQSQGIGRQMIEYAIDVCRKNGCYKMVLSSSLKCERAHQFYENLGFEKHGFSFLIEI